MLTDPVDERNEDMSRLKSRSYIWLGKDLLPLIFYPEDRNLELGEDSVRLKTTAPKGERMAY